MSGLRSEVVTRLNKIWRDYNVAECSRLAKHLSGRGVFPARVGRGQEQAIRQAISNFEHALQHSGGGVDVGYHMHNIQQSIFAYEDFQTKGRGFGMFDKKAKHQKRLHGLRISRDAKENAIKTLKANIAHLYALAANAKKGSSEEKKCMGNIVGLNRQLVSEENILQNLVVAINALEGQLTATEAAEQNTKIAKGIDPRAIEKAHRDAASAQEELADKIAHADAIGTVIGPVYVADAQPMDHEMAAQIEEMRQAKEIERLLPAQTTREAQPRKQTSGLLNA